MELILHIGMPKTGSSTIQAFLLKNKIPLKKLGFFYDLAHKFTGNTSLIFSSSFEALIKKLIKQAKREKCDKLLISSEVLFEMGTKEEQFAYLSSVFRENFSKIHVIAFLRRQDLWIESMWKQTGLLASSSKMYKDLILTICFTFPK
jgi:hypothetical protein